MKQSQTREQTASLLGSTPCSRASCQEGHNIFLFPFWKGDDFCFLPSREHIGGTLLAVPSLVVLSARGEVIDLMTESRERGTGQLNCPFLLLICPYLQAKYILSTSVPHALARAASYERQGERGMRVKIKVNFGLCSKFQPSISFVSIKPIF